MNAEPADPQAELDSPPPESDHPPETSANESDAQPSRSSRRLGLPAWTLGLLVLALTAVLVWAGNALIRSRQQFPAQAPTATAKPSTTLDRSQANGLPATPVSTSTPAVPDATLILVADLYPLTGGSRPDRRLTRQLHETLVARIAEAGLTGKVSAQRLREPVSDAAAARAAGQAGNADHVLWSSAPGTEVDTARQHIFLTRVDTQLYTRAPRHGQDLTLSVPVEHDLYPSPTQEGWLDQAADLLLAIAANDRLDLDAADPLWDRALGAAQESEAPELAANVHLYRGNARALDGQYDQALTEYDAAIESAPDLALAYVNRGSVHHARGDDDAALQDLEQALALDPGLANAYYHRANVYRALDQAELALADLDKALELEPQHARAYAGRGLVLHNAGAHEPALEDYTRAIELSPGAADAYLNRGGTYATLGMFEAALEDYARAIELSPDDADAYYNRGTVYAMMESYDEALADLDRALALKPDFAQVYGNRGLVYRALGQTEKAVADLERFLEMSDNPEWRAIIEEQLAELKGE